MWATRGATAGTSGATGRPRAAAAGATGTLVAASGHTESVLCFRSGRVDVLVAKTELTELVLGVELAGWRLNDGSYGSDGKRLGKGSGGGSQERLRRKGERKRLG